MVRSRDDRWLARVPLQRYLLVDRERINGLTYMNVDERFPAAVQGARKLTVICNVPNVDFV